MGGLQNSLEIWLGQSLLGLLTRTFSGYEIKDITASLPSSLQGEKLTRFLASLLPRGRALQLCAQTIGCAPDDYLSLLQVMGRDCPGNIRFGMPQTGELEKLTSARLLAYLQQLPEHPLLAGTHGISQTLSGGRPKLGLVKTPEGLALPLNGHLSTHVIKPDLSPWQGAALTEVFCQRLAQRCNLPAVETELVMAGTLACSLVTRFDRVQGKAVHAETFAQVLGKGDTPRESDSGPTLADCFGWLEDTVDDVRAEQQVLMDYVLFNALIGNSNADSSLFALIYEGSARPRIAPLHGALCAPVFPHLPQRLALKIGQAGSISELRATDWQHLASHTQLEPEALATRALDLARRVRGESRSLAMTFAHLPDHHVSSIILSVIEQNCMNVAQSLKSFVHETAI